ncbi:MFS transporter [Actinoplanes derwentensis]|uniref:Major Facilitator Superfamily protein n=1 Tax=Actinoplanes derwentensis TaxID=113562 RepID=A0A1H2C1F7_9ACTN|nr:MFS transporter [Actinoplanes derwentensis]GID84660.1 MFS transporter [Actinoplanes derwentensis]SDT64009.1 Major Facilitator Superfamily protein [Actinoplanes derwentensis]
MRRNAALFVLISVLSGLGGTALTLAVGIWIFDLTGDPGLAALASLGVYLPSLAAPWLGVLVDRFPRRALLIGVEAGVAAVLFALLPVDSAGQVWLIYVAMLVRGVGYVLLDAGESALLPAALPADRLGDVNGWRSSAQEGMKLLAPLGGAALYTWVGPRPVIVLCAVLPLISAGLYALLRFGPTVSVTGEPSQNVAGQPTGRPGRGGAVVGGGPRAGVEGESGRRASLRWSSVREGLLMLTAEPLRSPVLLGMVAIGVSGLTNAAVLSQIVDGLGLPAAYLGVLSSVQGAGSIVAGLLVGRLLARAAAVRVALLGVLIFALSCVARSVPWWPAMIVGSLLAGAGLVWALIAAVTAVQTGTPGHLLGRVSATSNMALFGPMALTIPLGAALIGFGARAVLLIGAGLLVLTMLAVRRSGVLQDGGRAAAGR